MKSLWNDFLIHKNFLTTIIISLFCCEEKIFVLKGGENAFWRNVRNFFRMNFLFVFWTLQVSSWNVRKIFFEKKYKEFYKLGSRKLHFPKHKKNFFCIDIWKSIRVAFFIFFIFRVWTAKCYLVYLGTLRSTIHILTECLR